MIADISIIPPLSKFRTLFNKPCFNHFVRAVKGRIVRKFVEWSIELYEKIGNIREVVKTAMEGLY